MADLELVGIHPDGDHLIVMDSDGGRHRLVIDEALRAAVRRDRPMLEKVRSDVSPRPRQIQALIRAGASAQDVADEAGVAVEQVRRYEGPVLAEREHVATRAKALRVGKSADSPTLGDLVLDRLAARGVAPEALSWDARRQGTEPWQVLARFHAGQKDQEAAWEVDLTSATVIALDDESRWLSETDLGADGARHLTAVRGARLYDVESDADIAPVLHAVDAVIRDSRPHANTPEDATPEQPDSAQTPADADDATRTEAMLDQLQGNRGVRQDPIVGDFDDEDDSAEEQPALWDDPPAAHPPASRPDQATDATVLPGPGATGTDQPGGNDGEEPAATKPSRSASRRKSRRTSVPSWDEIVFGAKDD